MSKQINDKMDQAIINDDFDQIESIVLNPKHAYVKCSEFNIFTGKLTYVNKWVDISNVGEYYFEDLSGDCQDYVMNLPKYKDMDYDQLVDDYNKPIEQKDNKRLEELKKAINNK